MLFSPNPRCQYGCNQLADVICQLRFPEILSINSSPPAMLQERIRAAFPQYIARNENAGPLSGNPTQPTNAISYNYQFTSADGRWRINLTSRFISIACNHYTNWETFAQKLDAPLASFISIYKPAFFERIGLRYMNFFSRQALELDNVPFSHMFQPAYLGPLGEEDVSEQAALRCSVDTEITLQGGCRAKIHAGPGIVRRNGQTDKEVKFILDQDLYTTGNIPVNHAAGTMEILHAQAYPIFRGAITDLLHNAMDPEPIL